MNLSSDELNFLLELLDNYFEKELDLTQREWGFAKGIQEVLTQEVEDVWNG